MLSKCLNPLCSAPFRYLREDRIFHLEISSTGGAPAVARRREYFWLWGRCCATFTVVVKDGAGTVQPRLLELASAERLERGAKQKNLS
jgi:hypothetical protein